MMMEVLFLFFSIQIFCDYASDPFSVSPVAVRADVGQTVNLSCEFKSDLDFGKDILWYKHHADEPPVAIKTTDCQLTGCRATKKIDYANRTSVLEIRDVRVKDSGFYYCAEKKSFSLLVKGPRLIVGDSSTNRTCMQLFFPPSEVNGSVPLVCLVGGLSSKQIGISWNISGQITEGWSDPGTCDPDQSCSVRSQVLVPVTTWRNGGVSTCIAQFGGAGKTRTMGVSRSNIDPDQATPPVAVQRLIPLSIYCCLPAAIFLGLLVMLVIVIFIWIFKECKSGTHRQSAMRQGRNREAQSQESILYASLDFAASSTPRR